MEKLSGEGLKAFKLAKKTIYGLGVVFLIISLIFMLKIVNGDTCGREAYTYYDGGSVQLATELDAAGEIVLQHNPFNEDKNIKEWQFCFTANATDAVELHVVNSADYVLAHAIIGQDVENHCYGLSFPANATFNYIGLQCLTCAPQDPRVFFYEEVLGEQVERVVETSNSFSVTDDNTLDWVLYGYPSCWESVKYFTYWYLTGAIILLIIIVLLFGEKKAEEVLNNFD